MSQPRHLNFAARTSLSIIRNTFLCRGVFRRAILGLIRKRVHHPIITDFCGVPFIFSLDNTTEAKALFGQYNMQELAFMRAGTADQPAPVFVDLGANCGFYTQNFLALGKGVALAIEPNPAMRTRVQDNYALLQHTHTAGYGQLILVPYAVGAARGVMELELDNGLGAAHIVDQKSPTSISIQVETLLSLLQENKIDRIDVLKADIEGYEDKALVPFFAQAPEHLFPQHIIIEHTSSGEWDEDLFALLQDKGYVTAGKTRGNLLLSRTQAR